MLAALQDHKQLVDVRSPQEFSGELIAMPGYETEGAQRAAALHPTQAAAQAAATERLQQRPGGGEVIIHDRHGQIRDSNTINRRDPFPPRG